MSMCIMVYCFVAREPGGIPFSGAYPIFVYLITGSYTLINLQYNGGFLPDIILLTLCDYIWEPF